MRPRSLTPTLAEQSRAHLIISALEHPSVARTADHLATHGWRVDRLPADRRRRRPRRRNSPDLLRPDTRLVSVMLASNETGVLQPVAEIAALCRERGVLVHTDAVQAVGKTPRRLPRPRRRRPHRSPPTNSTAPSASASSSFDTASRLRLRFTAASNKPASAPAPKASPSPSACAPPSKPAQREADARRERMTALRDQLERAAPRRRPARRRHRRRRAAPPAHLEHRLRRPRSAGPRDGPRPRRRRLFHRLRLRQRLQRTLAGAGRDGASGEQISSSLRFSLGATTTPADIDEAARRILSVVQPVTTRIIAPIFARGTLPLGTPNPVNYGFGFSLARVGWSRRGPPWSPRGHASADSACRPDQSPPDGSLDRRRFATRFPRSMAAPRRSAAAQPPFVVGAENAPARPAARAAARRPTTSPTPPRSSIRSCSSAPPAAASRTSSQGLVRTWTRAARRRPGRLLHRRRLRPRASSRRRRRRGSPRGAAASAAVRLLVIEDVDRLRPRTHDPARAAASDRRDHRRRRRGRRHRRTASRAVLTQLDAGLRDRLVAGLTVRLQRPGLAARRAILAQAAAARGIALEPRQLDRLADARCATPAATASAASHCNMSSGSLPLDGEGWGGGRSGYTPHHSPTPRQGRGAEDPTNPPPSSKSSPSPPATSASRKPPSPARRAARRSSRPATSSSTSPAGSPTSATPKSAAPSAAATTPRSCTPTAAWPNSSPHDPADPTSRRRTRPHRRDR